MFDTLKIFNIVIKVIFSVIKALQIYIKLIMLKDHICCKNTFFKFKIRTANCQFWKMY